MMQALCQVVLVAACSAACANDVTLDVESHWKEIERGRAMQVAMPMPVVIDLATEATRLERDDGSERWTLRLHSPGAIFMSAKFSSFLPTEGVRVRLHAAGEVYSAGPFTTRHITPSGRFGSPMIPGEVMTIDVEIPAGAQRPSLILESVSHGYRDVLGMGRFFPSEQAHDGARGGPFACQRDIVCPEGQPYLHLKDAAAEGYDGTYVCSGQLVNNVRQDGRALYLTAAHCEWWLDPDTMAFYWDYANETCGGNDYPSFTFSTGSTNLYHSTNPDFDINLLELHGVDLEGAYDVYFAGWNRGEDAPTRTVAITHPADKPLQVAIDDDPAIDCVTARDCPGGWGPWYWRIDDYDVGVTQGGSSGGGLYDQDQLLVGVLTGGVGTTCDNFGWDEYFKLSTEWDELRPFLDPDDTGAMSVAGWDGSSVTCFADFNADGVLDIFDVLSFLEAFEASDVRTDVNEDGSFDIFDIVAFLGAFDAGCP